MYKYGMRLRPLGIGCQPSRWCKYEDVVWYKFKLTDEELEQYDMDYLGTEN